jgi:hypothetical protein
MDEEVINGMADTDITHPLFIPSDEDIYFPWENKRL